MLTRLEQVISLGSNVGSGLFIATGKALADGGPGSMFIAYLIVCIGVWANLQCLTEMTIAFPLRATISTMLIDGWIQHWVLELDLQNGLVGLYYGSEWDDEWTNDHQDGHLYLHPKQHSSSFWSAIGLVIQFQKPLYVSKY